MSWKPDLKQNPNCTIVLVAREDRSSWDVYEQQWDKKRMLVGTTDNCKYSDPVPPHLIPLGPFECTVITLNGKRVEIFGTSNGDIRKELNACDPSLGEISISVLSTA